MTTSPLQARGGQRTGLPSFIVSLGSIEVVTLSPDRVRSLAQLTEFAYTRADKFVLLLVEAGAVSISQRQRKWRLCEGQYALFDCANEVTFSGVESARALAVFIPAILLRTRLRNVGTIAGHAFSSAGSSWRIAASLLRILIKEVERLPVPSAYLYGSQVVEMVSVAVETDPQISSDSGSFHSIFKRSAAYIQANLADSTMDPARIAAAMGISVRYLHKIFQDAEVSVCESVRKARLAAAKRDLADPQKAALHISEISFRVGFRRQAHFATAFKAEYGVSASEWRKMALEMRSEPYADGDI